MAALRRAVGGTIVLDAQALSRLAAGDPGVRSLVREAYARDCEVVTAASTLAEVLRGAAKDAPVRQVLKRVTVVPVDFAVGRQAGDLLGATGVAEHQDTADSLLAAIALRQQRPVILLTSDPAGMARLTDEPHRKKAERVTVVAV